MKSRMHGFTLLEMAVVLVVLGLVAVVAAKLAPQLMDIGETPADVLQRVAIEEALTGFAFARGRLPCPDSGADGVEDCGPTVERGSLPYRSLGLPDQARNSAGLPLVYAVYRNIGANLDQAASADRFLPLLPVGTSTVALETALGNRNGLDLCESLHSAGLAAVDLNYLHVDAPADPRNVAWLLLDPGRGDADGDGNVLDGSNIAGLGFERADRPANATYDDRITTMAFGALWARLGCAAAFSAAGHAHANAALSAVVMLKALQDYDTQLDIINDLTAADIAAATAGVLDAAAAVALAVAETSIAAAEALVTAGAAAPNIGLAAAAVAAGVAATVVAAIALASATNAHNATQSQLDDFRAGVNGNPPMVSQAMTLSTSIRQNAVDADAAGLYTR